MKNNNKILYISIAILVLAAVSFIFIPGMAQAGNSGVPVFGSWDGEQVKYEQGTYFVNRLQAYLEEAKQSNQEISDYVYQFYLYRAFSDSINRLAFIDYANSTGYTLSNVTVVVNVEGSNNEANLYDQYQRVEYITSAEEGAYPYIITDFIADNSSGMEIIASFPVMQDRIPMGSREDSGTTRFYCVYPLSASSVYYGFNSGSSISCSLTVNTVYRLQTNFLNSRLVNVYEDNGTRKASASINAILTPHSIPVSIFGYNSGSSGAVTSKREYKLYSARCSRGHEVVREYIPCYRKSDGVVGLYEKFTGTFLTAENGLLFAKGADIEW